MKRIFILIPLLFVLISFKSNAQNFTIKGKVNGVSGATVANASVFLINTKYKISCDSSGNYHLEDIKPGKYTLQISAVGYKSLTRELNISGNLIVNIVMEENVQQLKDVNVQAEKEKTFGITRLKAVDGTTINAGKKSEVIVMDDIVANKAS